MKQIIELIKNLGPKPNYCLNDVNFLLIATKFIRTEQLLSVMLTNHLIDSILGQ